MTKERVRTAYARSPMPPVGGHADHGCRLLHAQVLYIADPSMHAIPTVTMSPDKNWVSCQSADNQVQQEGCRAECARVHVVVWVERGAGVRGLLGAGW